MRREPCVTRGVRSNLFLVGSIHNLFLVGSPLFCARGPLHLYRHRKYIPVHIIHTRYVCMIKSLKLTQSVTTMICAVCRVPRVCAVCRVSRISCFQTFVLDREHSNLCFGGSPLFCAEEAFFTLSATTNTYPVYTTDHTYHTRYVDKK